jgi:beta-N-acetylhexosaminidase
VDVVIVSSYVGQNWDAVSASAPQAFASFVQRLAAKGKRPVVVTFGNPYLLQQIPGVPAYLVAWGGFPPSQIAAARALLGQRQISGKLPISIPAGNGVVPRGSGLARPGL